MKSLLYLALLIGWQSTAAIGTDSNPPTFCFQSIRVDPAPRPSQDSALSVSDDFMVAEYAQRYEMLSKQYKENLKRVFGVANSADYAKRESERHYEYVVLESALIESNMLTASTLQATYLVCWEQEGYLGVSTYIFVMTKAENDDWKIANLIACTVMVIT